MCSPSSSTTWYEDYKQIEHLKEWKVLPGLQWALKGGLLDDIINHIDNVELLYFSGGEPLLNKKHNFILNYLIDKKLSHNISLIYDTNGTQISKKHIELWHAFKKVSLNFSIDGTYEIDEYIRHPIKFDEVLTKFNLLKDTDIKVKLQCALGAHNLPDIINIFTLQEEYNFAGVSVSIVHWPEFMQIKYLSDSIKIKCKQEFNKLNNNRLQDMLSALEFDNSKPIELQKYFAQLDRIRNTDHKRIFTWIYE
jgi:MoaA/NifB/PqqE/SkfB family radical SAM enzyme